MNYLYVYLITVTVISASVPQDLCETCVPTQDCPLFENLNITDQLIWMEEFPCGPRPNNENFEVPPGFASAAKGDYVCCSSNVWGVQRPEHFRPHYNHQSLTDIQPNNPSDNDKIYYNDDKNPNDKPENDHIVFYNNKNPTNSLNNEKFNNYYYNKYNRTKNPHKYSDNKIDPSNHNLDDYYNPNGNNSNTVWYPDRSRNYDNTDYWKTNRPENNESSNERNNWNDRPDQGQNIGNTQRPPLNEVKPPAGNNPPENIIRPPTQCDSPENEERPPVGNTPPGNIIRLPPIPNDYTGNEGRPPNQFDTSENWPRPVEYNPPAINNPPTNIVRPPIQYDPPRNGNYPPGNMIRPPYNPSGNIPRPPNQNMPPGYDNMGRPPQYYGPGDRQPYQNYNPGYSRPDNQYYHPGNSGPSNHNYNPRNVEPPNRFFPPGNNNFNPGPPYRNNPWEPNYKNYDRRNRRDDNHYNDPYYNEDPYNYYDQDDYPGNFGGGQCRLTSFPPDAQSECCGRQLSDYDRITDWNNRPTNTNYWPTTPYPSGRIWRGRREISENDDTDVTVEKRIAGGHATELYEYPWTVLILTTFDYGNREAAFNCGGGLISAKYVLTAGHCVYDQGGSVKSVQINLAEYDKNSFPKDCKSTRSGRMCIDNIMLYAEEVITHPQYENENLVNDIALLRLRGSAPYTDYIRPICLPTINIDEPQFANLQFEVAGWGRVGTYSSSIKQSTVLHLVNHDQCKQHYPQLTNRHLCASGKRGEDTCKGDSGGPLMVLYRGTYYVAGIVSGKRADSPCGTSVPSLYTNVYLHVDWIRSTIRN